MPANAPRRASLKLSVAIRLAETEPSTLTAWVRAIVASFTVGFSAIISFDGLVPLPWW